LVEKNEDYVAYAVLLKISICCMLTGCIERC